MESFLLKKAAIQSVALMLAVVTISFSISQYRLVTIEASNTINIEKEYLFENNTTILGRQDLLNGRDLPQLLLTKRLLNFNEYDQNSQNNVNQTVDIVSNNIMKNINPQIYDLLSNQFLMIQKPKSTNGNSNIDVEDLYMTRSIRITLTGLASDYMSSEMVFRIRNEEIFFGEPVYTEVHETKLNEAKSPIIIKYYGNDLSHGIAITHMYDDVNKDYSAELIINLDRIYAHKVYEDDSFYYIDLRNPKEVYDRILVIDPGHGGSDGGAITKDKKYYEKDINLSITKHLKQLLDQENIKVYYTRLKDDKLYLRQRVLLANDLDSDFFISIHCNASKASSPNGTEVLYYDTNFNGVAAKKLAEIFLNELENSTSLRKRGLVKVKKDDIFILDLATIPTVLIEVGYMSNHKDMAFLSKDENIKLVALGIYNGIIKAYDELK